MHIHQHKGQGMSPAKDEAIHQSKGGQYNKKTSTQLTSYHGY